MVLVTCDNNCYLSNKMKFHSRFSFFETRKKLAIFILNVLLNIEKHYKEFCKCKDNFVCPPCTIAKIYEKEQYQLFSQCLNFDFLVNLQQKLHGAMCFSLDEK